MTDTATSATLRDERNSKREILLDIGLFLRYRIRVDVLKTFFNEIVFDWIFGNLLVNI